MINYAPSWVEICVAIGILAVGKGVSEFIGEATLALEMGAFLEEASAAIREQVEDWVRELLAE